MTVLSDEFADQDWMLIFLGDLPDEAGYPLFDDL